MNIKFIFLIIIFIRYVPLSLASNNPIYIPDEVLKTCIEEKLGISDPNASDMLLLYSLRCRQTLDTYYTEGIKDLTGLEYAQNVESLDFRYNYIDNLSPLSTLYNLTELRISKNIISDLSPISGLINLTHLDVHGNYIQDLTPLSGLTNLKTLIIRLNQIDSLAPISGLINLNRIDAYYNSISNISSLSGLMNLNDLNLSCNNIESVSALASLINLRILDLEYNNIKSISALCSMTALSQVRLRYNPLNEAAYESDLQYMYDNIPGIWIDYDINTEAPQNVQASNGKYPGYILITWDNVSHGPKYSTYYMVSRSQSISGEVMQVSDWSTECSFEDRTCKPDTYYIYWVHTAISQQGDSQGQYSEPDRGWCTVDPNSCSLTISSTAGGSVIEPEEKYIHGVIGQNIEIKAEPWDGDLFTFDYWSGSAVDTNSIDVNLSTIYVELKGIDTIRAHFKANTKSLYIDAHTTCINAPSEESNITGMGTLDCPFKSIQSAIDVAQEGSTLIVHSGTYFETLNLQGKNVHLTGMALQQNDYPMIDANGLGTVINCIGDEDTYSMISGLIITGGKDFVAGALYCKDSSIILSHCIISGNQALDVNGAAVYCDDSHVVLNNCTIVQNRGGTPGGGIALINSLIDIDGSIIWYNHPTQIQMDNQSRVIVQYSDIQEAWSDLNSPWDMGMGILSTDPLFIRPGFWAGTTDGHPIWVQGDYHLLSQAGRWDPNTLSWMQDHRTSPCVDAGNPHASVLDEPMPNGGITNIGAYANTVKASKSLIIE